jgi:predicted alpha/beta-fold hydrolase
VRSELPIPRWLRSAHVQTIGAAVPLHVRSRELLDARVELLRIASAGGHVHAKAWWSTERQPGGASSPRVAVVILHGIAGSSESHCCVRAAVAVHRAGYHAVRMDMRSAGDSVADAPSLYHAGLTEDLDAVVRHLARDPRVSGVAVLGFSGGGSIALKLAGQWADRAPREVLAVASVSAPLDYTRVAPRMDGWSCLPYRYHVLRGLVDRARRFAELHPERAHYAAADLAGIKRFRAFDRDIIGPMHGFADVDAYYVAASAGPGLCHVEVPTLLVHAADDPMVPGDSVTPWTRHASRAVRAEITAHGGHLGWLGGLDEASWVTSWSARRVLDFLGDHAPPCRVAVARS